MRDFYVSPQETKSRVSDVIVNESISGALVDKYEINPENGATVIVQIFD